MSPSNKLFAGTQFQNTLDTNTCNNDFSSVQDDRSDYNQAVQNHCDNCHCSLFCSCQSTHPKYCYRCDLQELLSIPKLYGSPSASSASEPMEGKSQHSEDSNSDLSEPRQTWSCPNCWRDMVLGEWNDDCEFHISCLECHEQMLDCIPYTLDSMSNRKYADSQGYGYDCPLCNNQVWPCF